MWQQHLIDDDLGHLDLLDDTLLNDPINRNLHHLFHDTVHRHRHFLDNNLLNVHLLTETTNDVRNRFH